MVVQPALVAGLGRDIERVLRRGRFAQCQFHRLCTGHRTELLGLFVAGHDALLDGVGVSIQRAIDSGLAFPVAPVELPVHPRLVGLVVNAAVVQQVGAFLKRLAQQQCISSDHGCGHKPTSAQRHRRRSTTCPSAHVAGNGVVDLGLCGGGVALLQQLGGAASGHDRIGACCQQAAGADQGPGRGLAHQQLQGHGALLTTWNAKRGGGLGAQGVFYYLDAALRQTQTAVVVSV